MAVARFGSAPEAFAQSSFFFQQRQGKLDLRRIARIDLERVVEEVDIDVLQQHLENITFANVTASDMTQYSDEAFVRLYRLAQLTIEYLLNVQNTLFMQSKALMLRGSELEAAVADARTKLRKERDSSDGLKKDVAQKRRNIRIFERLLKSAGEKGAGAGANQLVQQQQQQQQQQGPSVQEIRDLVHDETSAALTRFELKLAERELLLQASHDAAPQQTAVGSATPLPQRRESSNGRRANDEWRHHKIAWERQLAAQQRQLDEQKVILYFMISYD